MLKKIALAAMIGAALISVAGCGSSDKKSNGAASGSKNVTIGFSVSTQNNPFFVTMANSVKAAADKAGVNVKIVDAQNDPAKQANDIADLLQGNISVLIVNPVDSAAISTLSSQQIRQRFRLSPLTALPIRAKLQLISLPTTSKAAKWQLTSSFLNLAKVFRLLNWKVFQAHLLHVNAARASITLPTIN